MVYYIVKDREHQGNTVYKVKELAKMLPWDKDCYESREEAEKMCAEKNAMETKQSESDHTESPNGEN